MEQFFNPAHPESGFPDIQLCIFPHLREFLVFDSRLGEPQVRSLSAEEVFTDDFFRTVEHEFLPRPSRDGRLPLLPPDEPPDAVRGVHSRSRHDVHPRAPRRTARRRPRLPRTRRLRVRHAQRRRLHRLRQYRLRPHRRRLGRPSASSSTAPAPEIPCTNGSSACPTWRPGSRR